MQLIKPNTHIAFLAKARGFAALSAGLVIASIGMLLVNGLNFGIDFEGGTEMLFSFKRVPEMSALRQTVTDLGFKNAAIQTFGASGDQIMVRVREVSSLDAQTQLRLADGTKAAFGDELLEYDIKPAGGLITVVLKAPRPEPVPEAAPPPADAKRNVITIGGKEIDLSNLPVAADGTSGISFEVGPDGKPEVVNPAGTEPRERLVLAAPADAGTLAPEAASAEVPPAVNPAAPEAAKNDWGSDKRAAMKKHFEGMDLRLAGEIELLRADGRNEYRVGFAGVSAEVLDALSVRFPDSGIKSEGIYYVGPQVGEQLRNEGILSVLYALLGILIYIALRFDFTFAPGAIVALIHDVLITMGIFSLFSLKFDLPIVAALLTIVGYSLNDTIVVYDRIREQLQNTPEGTPLAHTVDSALNNCLSRTILTSMTTLFVVVVLWVFGGPMIREFAIAMTIGVVVGTYSSMFVASPLYLGLVHWWEARQEALDLA